MKHAGSGSPPGAARYCEVRMSVSYKDYYRLLGVDRGADDATIAEAYKKLARKYHPDLNPGDKSAEEKFKEVNEAYEVLKDPKKRQLYDQLGPNWEQGQQFQGNPFGGQGGTHFTFNGQNMDGSGFSDFFESLFGRGGFGGFGGAGGAGGYEGNPFGGSFRQAPRRGRDVEAELVLTLEEVLAGGPKKVTLNGSSGVRSLSVNIPSGIREGAKLRLAGQGEPGPAGAGDLFLKIRYLPHPYFKVDGDNLQCDVDVAPWEAVLGGRVRVHTLEGDVELNLPAGTGSGKKLRLRGRGLGPAGHRGDLYARVMVKVPSSLTPEERSLWEQLASRSSFKAR